VTCSMPIRLFTPRLVLLAVLLAVPAAPAQAPEVTPQQKAAADREQKFKQHMAAGQELYEAKKFGDAIGEFRAAVKLEPNSSPAYMWLGRALGRSAETMNRLRAAFIVSDVRESFERAVRLDPDNVEARSDLLDFYLQAPGAFGGGIDKARREAREISKRNNAEGHSALARIALKERKYDVAEREYRLAIEANPKHVGYQRDLDAFLKKYGSQLAHGRESSDD
jgi:tetratricopeptide (TPR) repeat protein